MISVEELLAADPNLAPMFAAQFRAVCPYCQGHNAACTNCAGTGHVVEERDE